MASQAINNVKEDTNTSPIADIYALKTGHLTEKQCAFFKEWEALIALEEVDMHRFKKELWTMRAREREEKGRCLARMILVLEVGGGDGEKEKEKEKDVRGRMKSIHQFTYKFVRGRRAGDGKKIKGKKNVDDDESSLLNGHMSVGDAIMVSVEPGLLALARGFVRSAFAC